VELLKTATNIKSSVIKQQTAKGSGKSGMHNVELSNPINLFKLISSNSAYSGSLGDLGSTLSLKLPSSL
jgi:hypothetical protein